MWTKIIAGAIGVAALGGATVAMAQEADPEWLRGPVAVIEDLVTDGTITRDQADTIVDTFRARRQAMGTRHEEMHEFWSDGVLTAEEITRLEVPNPFTAEGGPFAEALSDGQITRDEFDTIKLVLKPLRGHHRDHRPGV